MAKALRYIVMPIGGLVATVSGLCTIGGLLLARGFRLVPIIGGGLTVIGIGLGECGEAPGDTRGRREDP